MAIKTGGRQKGTPNKKTQAFKEKVLASGFDPFDVLMMAAKGDWKGLGYESKTMKIAVGSLAIPIEVDRINLEMRVNAAKEACKYIHPQMKAIEHSGPDGGPIETKDVLDERTDEELTKMVKQIIKNK